MAKPNFIEAMQRRTASVTVGASTVRGIAPAGTVTRARAHLADLDLTIFKQPTERRFRAVLDRETVADIQQFLRAQPEAGAAEAKSHFGEKYSYGELKMAIRHVQKHEPSR